MERKPTKPGPEPGGATQQPRAEGAASPEAQDQRYRLLFERNLAGVYRTTLDGKILDCNDSFAHIVGCADRAEVMRATVFDFYRDPEERRGVTERLRKERHLDNYELRLRRRDGSPLWLLENVSLVANPDGT